MGALTAHTLQRLCDSNFDRVFAFGECKTKACLLELPGAPPYDWKRFDFEQFLGTLDRS